MNKVDARTIAETITNDELQMMLDVARIKVKDWTKISNINKSMTIGVSWNIFGSDFDVNQTQHRITKINMIREFGEFLPDEMKPKHDFSDRNPVKVIHQEPIFKNR